MRRARRTPLSASLSRRRSPRCRHSRRSPAARIASAENVAHSVAASTNVVVAIDDAGTPFAVTATQRLDVRGVGDYFFTIGAPVLTVRAPADSASVPGMRTGSILWAGFDPGERAARRPRDTRAGEGRSRRCRSGFASSGDTVALENATSVSVGTFDADAPRAPLIAYLARLRGDVAHGRTPLQTSVPLASTPANERITVTAPLHVTGHDRRAGASTCCSQAAHGSTASGRIDLRVEPIERVDDVTAAERARAAARGDPGDAHARAGEPVRRVPREPRSGRREPDGLRLPHGEPAACRADRGRRPPPADVGRRRCSSSACSRPRSRPARRCGLDPDRGPHRLDGRLEPRPEREARRALPDERLAAVDDRAPGGARRGTSAVSSGP